jgi:hypothetical protein
MKKFFRKIADKIVNRLNMLANAFLYARTSLANNRAEGFVDSGVKILIAVVIGALLLGGMYTLFGSTILPTLTKKIQDLFNYAG